MKTTVWFAAATASCLFGASAGLASLVYPPAPVEPTPRRAGLAVAAFCEGERKIDGIAALRFVLTTETSGKGRNPEPPRRSPSRVQVELPVGLPKDRSAALAPAQESEPFLPLPEGLYELSVEALGEGGSPLFGCERGTLSGIQVAEGQVTEAIVFVKCSTETRQAANNLPTPELGEPR